MTEKGLGFNERMYVVECRILIKDTGSGDAFIAVNYILSNLPMLTDGHVLDGEATRVGATLRLSYDLKLSDIPKATP